MSPGNKSSRMNTRKLQTNRLLIASLVPLAPCILAGIGWVISLIPASDPEFWITDSIPATFLNYLFIGLTAIVVLILGLGILAVIAFGIISLVDWIWCDTPTQD